VANSPCPRCVCDAKVVCLRCHCKILSCKNLFLVPTWSYLLNFLFWSTRKLHTPLDRPSFFSVTRGSHVSGQFLTPYSLGQFRNV
jgi:hypothetical protein